MKKILLSMFALCAMFTFVVPAAAQVENEDGSFTYHVRESGAEGGVSTEWSIARYYEEGDAYYDYYRTMSSKDYMLKLSCSYYFGAWSTYAPYVYGGNTLTYECLDDDYVISSIGFYPYGYSTFDITDENGNVFSVVSDGGGAYGDFVEIYDINASTVEITVGGGSSDGFYLVDYSGEEFYGGITVAPKELAGVRNVNAKAVKDNRIFDVQGREVLNPTRGLYIQNGKKFMVK